MTSRVVQAYIAVQIFVERCLMNLEAPQVVVDLTKDDTWNQWEWMSRYRVWEANREVFLYPENWLIESQRPNRTEIYQKLEQEVHQGESTTDYLETVVLNYIDRLDGLAHLLCHRHLRGPGDGDDLRGGAHAGRSARLLPPLLRQRRVDRVDADSARHQGAPGDSGAVPGPRLPVLAGRQGVERAAADAAGGAAIVYAAEPERWTGT